MSTVVALAAERARTRRRRPDEGYGAKVWIGRIALIAAVLAIWQLAAMKVPNAAFTVSSPVNVVEKLAKWTMDGTLWFHAAITIQETVLGFALGTLAGLLAGFIIGPQRMLGDIIDPLMVALNSVPKVALAPLFIVWFGIGLPMKVILATVTVFFIVFFSTVSGVRSVDADLVNAVLLMGGRTRQITMKVVVPSALGAALTGLRIAIPYALIGAVIGELIASNRGLGYLISNSASQFDTAGVFAALIILTIIASVLNAIVDLIEARTSRWKTRANISGVQPF